MSRADLTFPVRVRPGAKRNAVGGRYDGPLGPALVVAVTAPAVDGKATRAVLAAVAAALGLRASQVSLRSGERSRDKLLEAPADARERLTMLLQSSTQDGGRG
jgi:uncharacterized protein